MNSDEFLASVNTVKDFIINYRTNISSRSLWPTVEEGELFGTLPKEPTENGESFDKVFQEFMAKIYPGILHWNHPENFSVHPSPNTSPCILANMLTAAMGGVGFSWKSCPVLTELEMSMVDWYGRLLGIPENFLFDCPDGGGSFHSTATNAAYSCIISARNKYLEDNECTLACEDVTRLVIYASHECSSFIPRICIIENIIFRSIETDVSGAMDIQALKRACQDDRGKHLIPLMVISTLGSFYSFAIDDIEEIGALKKEFQIFWVHIDATFGGSALMLNRYKNMRLNLIHADSIAAAPNKWLLVGTDCATLWVRNIENYQKPFIINPTYLETDLKNGVVDFRHFGINLSRRFRALKLWFTFRMFGKDGLLEALRRMVALAAKMAYLLTMSEYFEVTNTQYTFVNFVLKNSNNERNKNFLTAVHETKKIKLFGMDYRGRYVLRLSVINLNTRTKHIINAVEHLTKVAKSFPIDA